MTTYNVPHTFIPGTKAKASEINENFASVLEYILTTAQGSSDVNFSNISEAAKKVIYNNSVQSHLIGEIVSSVIPLTDANLHLLDGQKLAENGIYSDFVRHITAKQTSCPSIFCTESEWQSSVSNTGACAKFVYDETEHTLRLPLISGLIEATSEPNLLGTTTSELETTTSPTSPKSTVKVLYYIIVANETKQDYVVNIDNIATSLNQKLDKDFGNCDKPYITETYVNGNSWYRVWSDGWIEQGGSCATGSASSGYKGLTISLIKEFTTTNFNVQITGLYTTASSVTASYCKARTTSSISIISIVPGSDWMACGY